MSTPAKVTGADAELAHAAAQKVVQAQRRVAEFLRVGMRLPEIDRFVASTLSDLRCVSCFYLYPYPERRKRGPVFPSHACLSVNDCIVHGTAGYYEKPLVEGDVLKVDIGVVYQGWVGDAAWTYVFKAYPSDAVRRLMECGKEALRRGVPLLRPGKTYGAWAAEVQGCAQRYGFHVVENLGGHGIGRWNPRTREGLHGPPFVPNGLDFADSDLRRPCEPGTLVAVEPMIALGTGRTRLHPLAWPVLTADGSVAVHYEHDVLITDDGPRVLTEGMESLPDIVG